MAGLSNLFVAAVRPFEAPGSLKWCRLNHSKPIEWVVETFRCPDGQGDWSRFPVWQGRRSFAVSLVFNSISCRV